MRDEHLSTIPEKESDKVIKYSIENLIPIPSESKDLTNYKSECDMPVCDDSSSKNEGLDDIDSFSKPGKEMTTVDAINPIHTIFANSAITIIVFFLTRKFAGELGIRIDQLHRECVEASLISRKIPSGESKVHIEVFLVLWGNRLPILDGSLPLSRYDTFRKHDHEDHPGDDALPEGKKSAKRQNTSRSSKSVRGSSSKQHAKESKQKQNISRI
ncbi:hypothetical protein Tco_0598099 [Tanacetum coccineum]